jgi:hypothetical protein
MLNDADLLCTLKLTEQWPELYLCADLQNQKKTGKRKLLEQNIQKRRQY